MTSIGRNQPCPCGSGKKYKLCHLRLEEAIPDDLVRYRDSALGGITPREAASRPASRAKLDLLLWEMENRAARLPEPERFDFRQLRGELGLGA